MKPNKRYLGDSVYVEFSGYEFTLTTENGCGPTNKIVMDPEVYGALVQFVENRAPEWMKPPRLDPEPNFTELETEEPSKGVG